MHIYRFDLFYTKIYKYAIHKNVEYNVFLIFSRNYLVRLYIFVELNLIFF